MTDVNISDVDVRLMSAEQVFTKLAKSEGEIAKEIVDLDEDYAKKIAKAPAKSIRMRVGRTSVWVASKWQLANERDRAKGELFEQLVKMGVDISVINKQYPTAEDCLAMVKGE